MRRRTHAVAVRGASMLPALAPGDLLLVRAGAAVRPGDLVVARAEGELVVKRAAFRDESGWWLESDNQAAPGRRDSWDYGAVPAADVLGRAVVRYWPLPRLSLLSRPSRTSRMSRPSGTPKPSDPPGTPR